MVETEEDRLAFLVDFADEALPRAIPVDGEPYDVTAIFTEPHLNAEIGRRHWADANKADYSGQHPTLRARSADVLGMKAGRGQFFVRGKTWDIHDAKPDGTGFTIFRLMRA